MKNLKIGLILFLVVLVSGNANATGKLKVDVIRGKNEKVLVNVLLARDSKFEVNVTDSKGDIVYNESEISPSLDYKKIFDLSDLKDGKYTLKVKLDDEVNLSELVVKDGIVQFVKNDEEVSPNFKLNGKILEFSFPNSSDQNVRLLLYNNDTNHWIYQENLYPESDISQTLNLSKLYQGSYKAVLISGNVTFDYSFHLN